VMPECEEIQAIAAGDSFVAAATDAGIIRFFTTMGTQREVVALPGQVLALAAHDNKLAVAYHTSNIDDLDLVGSNDELPLC
jgi:chromosome transmission fidelity protein 4